VLDGLRPAGREQHVPEMLRRDLHNQSRRFAPGIGPVGGCERAQSVGLLLDRGDDARMLVPEVGEHQLRAEVQVAPSVDVDDVAPGAADEGRHVARSLHNPGVEDQLVEIHDSLRRSGAGRSRPLLQRGTVMHQRP
jgi:hypothetical protein